MKKLLMALATVSTVAFTFAGTIQWGSGAYYTAAGEDGGWSSTTIAASTPKYNVMMSLYLTDAAGWAQVDGKTQSEIYSWAKSQTATQTANTYNGSSYLAAVNIARDGEASKTYYSVLISEYTDATYGDMYMAAAKTFTTGTTGSQTVTAIFGGATGASVGGVRDWQAVPESTSGLLLLCGLGALALRRRRMTAV